MDGGNMKFTVIIPAYNVAGYIETCLKSVLSQTHATWEAIAVDDGSTDGTAAILDRYGKMDARINVIHQSNGGVSSARNMGLEMAKGDYIVFLDGDDALPREALANLARIIEIYPDDLITFDRKTFVKDEDVTDFQVVGEDVFVHYNLTENADAAHAFERVAGSLLAWNGCFCRKALSSVRFESFTNGEDALFGTTVFCHAMSCARTSLQLYLYRVGRPGSAVSSSSVKKVKSVCETTMRWCEVVRQWNMADCVIGSISRKLRSGVLGVLCGFVERVPPEERAEARRLVLDLFNCLHAKFPEYATSFGRIRGTIVRFCDRWCAFYLLERIPFAMRVAALRLDVVKQLKKIIRGEI